MRKQTPISPRLLFLLVTITFTIALTCMPIASAAQNISEVATAGPYTINLKLLPAETFGGSHPAMVYDSGAMAVPVNRADHPDHHLVVFIKKDGKPVENARVTITYRQSHWAQWRKLQVARMHAAGQGPETTHYGNNVKLIPGKYEIRVTVDAERFVTFEITIS